MDRYNIPYARPGQVIGLFGGSFDPPHQGHVHVTLEAMKAFGLDRVWWLVSPGNPLKQRGPAPLPKRLKAANAVMQHPDVVVTDIEALTGTRSTADTLAALQRLYPQVKFVWLMGADNLAQFHKWKNWRLIMDSVPVGVVARPGDQISARMSNAARVYSRYRIDGQARRLLGRAQAPAWCFANVPMIDVSSTDIRAQTAQSNQVLPE
ncbi:MAG: nicotinate-nucleotide adenylyltransferase [Pseudomonadota bacterium]